MKRFLVASALSAIAISASAGLTYKVQSTTTGVRSMTLAGTVNVDGPRMRFDVASGDGTLFKDNSLVLSSDGGKTMSIFDPAQFTLPSGYTKVDDPITKMMRQMTGTAQ